MFSNKVFFSSVYVKAAALVLLAALLTSACSAPKEYLPQSAPVLSEMGGDMIEVEPNLKREYPKGDQSPLEIERDTLEYEGGYILYPKALSGSRAEKINAEIIKRVRAHAGKLNTKVFTEYRIETNAGGLFSVLFTILDLNTNESLGLLPLTIDTASGEICAIDYYFEPNGDAWRTFLAERAERDAAGKGITLLKRLAPVTDDCDYFVCDGKLVLQYRLYEIATYSAGMPQLEIPLDELTPYLAKDSPLLRAAH